jgi:uncharacterized protein (TIGR03546 family)
MDELSRRVFPALHAVLLAEAHPLGLARGCSWGIALGLLPKNNLAAMTMLALMFLLRINLLAAFSSCILVSLFAYHLDPVLHAVGASFLTLGPLQPVFRGLFAIPLVPWSGLDNTVVAGSLLIGLLQLYPTQRLLCRALTARAEASRLGQQVQRIMP